MPQLLFLSRRNTVVLSGVTFVEAYSIKKKHPKANQTIEQIHNDTSNIQCLLCLRLRNKMGGKKNKIKCHYSVHLKGRHFPSSCDFLVFTLIYIGCLPWVLGNVVIIAAVSLKRACVAFFDKKHRYLFEGHHLVFTFILPPSLPEQFFLWYFTVFAGLLLVSRRSNCHVPVISTFPR